jgi:serine/threonine-protein kinase
MRTYWRFPLEWKLHSPPAKMSKTPAQIDRYTVERKLSEGGMAEVFLAHRDIAGVQKRVVIKSVLPSFLSDQHFVAMMLNEARIAVGLSNPNIVQIEDLIEVENRPYIVMEYLDGQNLREILNRAVKSDQMLSLPFICSVLAAVLDGLDHAHNRVDSQGRPLGLVHRDVSLANIIVTYSGQVKLIDFGIAKATSMVDQELTQVGQLKGKSAYMSPEQVRREPIDRRADLFSAGVVLWEMLTRRRLFARRNDLDSLMAICGEDAPAPSSLEPTRPAELDAICLKALARDREQRYQDAGAMLEDLEAFMKAQGWNTYQAVQAQLAALFPDECAKAAPRPVEKQVEKQMVMDDWEDVHETIPLPSHHGYGPKAVPPPIPGPVAAEPEPAEEPEMFVESVVVAEPELAPEAEPLVSPASVGSAASGPIPVAIEREPSDKHERAWRSAEIQLLNQPMPGPSVYDDLNIDGSTVSSRRGNWTPVILLALAAALMIGAVSTAFTLREKGARSAAAMSLTGSPTATAARDASR